MALRLNTKGAVRLSWADDSMEAIFTLNPGDSQEELVSKLERIVNFVRDRTDKPALPERIPGMALGMAQTAHPRLVEVTEEQGMAMKKARPGSVVNGWAAYAGAGVNPPEVPEGADYELIPPEEQE